MVEHQGAGLRLQLLGPPCWRTPDGRGGALKKKQAALVAYVAAHGEVSRDSVAEKLWDSVGALYQTLYTMRRQVGHEIIKQDHVLRLLPDVHCDLSDDLSEWTTQALLDRSIFLDGTDLPPQLTGWLALQREACLARACGELLRRAPALQRSNALLPALRLACRLTELAPKNEAGWRARMWFHCLAHDVTAAVNAHDELLAHLPPGRSPGTESQELWRLVQQAARVPSLPTGPNPALYHPPRLVGRQAQWAALNDAATWHQPFLLRGEGGIGKSRLLGSFFSRRGQSVIVKALSADRHVPYATLASLLRELDEQYGLRPAVADRCTLSAVVPHWRAGADAPVVTDESRIYSAVRRLLERASAEHLRCIGIDDLHHADVASLALWRKLAEGEMGRLLQFGFAARAAAEGVLHDAIESWRGDAPSLRLVDLLPLSRDEVAELLSTLALSGSAAAVTADELHAQVGGNPQMLLETLSEVGRGWVPGQPLPRSDIVLAGLERRLRGVPVRALPLLQLAAVLGPDIGHVAQALGRPTREFEAWRADLEAQLVFSEGRFMNDTVREVALASLSPQQRQHWHAVAAATLTHDPRLPRARIAAHWEEAAHWPEAGAAYGAAARLAENAGRASEARTLYAQAVACLRLAADTAGEFDVLYESLPAELLLNDVRPAQLLAERLAALAATPHQQARVAVARALLAVSHYPRGDTALASTALAARATEDFADLQCDALGLHAAALAQAGRFDEALQVSHQAVAMAEADGRPRKAREIGTQRLYVLFEVSRVTEALALSRELMDAYEGAGDEAGAAAMEGHLALLQLTVDPAAAWHSAARACDRHRMVEASSTGPMAVMHRVALASSSTYLGRFGDALAALQERGQPISEGMVPGIRAKVQLTLANIWLLLGADQAATDALDKDDEAWPPAMQVQRCWALARAARLCGRDGAGHLRRMGVIHAQNPQAALAHTAWLEWARQGDASLVAQQMLGVQALYEQAGMSGAARAAQVRRIDRLLELDDADSMAEACRQAQQLQQQLESGAALHASTYLPEAWLVLARAMARAGDANGAAAARAAGRHWIAQVLRHVPAAWRDSFEQSNPINRELLAPGSG